MEDVQLALDSFVKLRKEDDPAIEQTLILISSLLAWDNTPRNLEEIREPGDESDGPKEGADGEGDNADGADGDGDGDKGDGDDDGDDGSKAGDDDADGDKGDGDEGSKEGDGDGEEKEAEVEEPVEEVEVAPKPQKRKKYLNHPFSEEDYLKRAASAEYAKIKEVEDRVLNFKKEGIKTFVISAGVLYGQGEAIFNNHFEKAWKQAPQKLPIIGEGKNHVPTIHVKDLARMVKKIFEAPPEQQYIFGIDNTKKPTQRKLIQAISDGVGTGLVESIDIPLNYEPAHPKLTPLNLHLDWRRFVMLNIKAKPSKIFVPPSAEGDGDDGGDGAEGDFTWHCKSGLAVNIQRVKEEFCKERGLKPFKVLTTG